MKAAVIREHGDPDRFAIEDIPDPEPRPGEVLVAVKAAALNHVDVWIRRGGRTELSWPHVMGSDGAGVVVGYAPGEGAEIGVEEGDEVVISPGLSCGTCEYCLRGEQSVCPEFAIVGMARPGTYAQFVALPAANVRPKPAHLDFDEAAALSLAHLTAWRMLFGRAELQAGETVLIHGIGGGVALAGLQLALLSGAETIVTSSSDEKLRRARKLGAHHAVNYVETDDVAGAVRALTGGRGVDVAFDAVGAATWPINFQAVRRGGRIVHCGVTTGAEVQADLQTLYWDQLSVLGSTLGGQDEWRLMLRAVETGGLKPVIDRIEPLENIVEMTRRMEAGEQFGKIVLRIPD